MTGNEPPAADVTCPQCGGEVPSLPFCVRCGYPFDEDAVPARRSGRRQFAAAPNERAWSIHVVSSLFPQLPDADMTYFGVALALGFATIVGLALGGLYPVALTVAAALVPLLVLLYLYAVDVYEDESPLVLGLTMVWGAVVGVALGLLLQNLGTPLGPPGFDLLGESDSLVRVVVFPLAGGVLALAALLVLLRYPRFNDILDGTTFGAATAVTLIGAETLVQAWPLVSGGLRPAGEAAPWIVRLVEIGILIPIIWAGVIGAAAGALWLRYRAPVRDRGELGPLGSPPLAFLVAAAFVIAAPAGLLVLDRTPGLIWVAALAAIALILLRRAIHLGLLEEADEIDIGPAVMCRESSPSDAPTQFLRTVRDRAPRAPEGAAAAGGRGARHAGRDAMTEPATASPPARRHPSGDSAARLRRWMIVVIALIGLAIIVGAAIVLLAANEPPPAEAPCKPNLPCVLSRTPGALDLGKLWVSKDLGYSFDYPDQLLGVTSEDGRSVQLGASGARLAIEVWVSGARASQSSVEALVTQRRDALAQRVLGLTEDDTSADRVVAPGLGFLPGAGGAYSGTLDSPSGPSSPASVAILAAGDGRINVVLSILVTGEGLDHKTVDIVRNGFGAVIVDTVRFR